MISLPHRAELARVRHTSTHAKLAWRYGSDRALEIIAGFDDATNEDIEKWRNLGRRRGDR